jgi:large subunit ribosomal protein L6
MKIPSGVTIRREGDLMVVKGPKGELIRRMRYSQVEIQVEADEVVVSSGARRKEITAMVGTYAAHLRNMMQGVSVGFEYTMKVVYSHFPIQLKIQEDKLEINNFLGEKQARYALLKMGVATKVSGDEVRITGIDKEAVGNTAANIEHATRIRNRDPRVFQDGIYLVTRA